MNYSFGLLKPDALKRGIEKEVLALIEEAKLEIVYQKRVRLTKKEVDIIWSTCLNENFYDELLKFSLSDDCIVFIVRSNNAIDKLSNLIGHYDPMKTKKGTIRHQFGKSVMENVIHSSKDKEMFFKEASLFFTLLELGITQE